MSEAAALAAFLCVVVVVFCVVSCCAYVDISVKRKSRARWAEMERRREESRDYWAARIREAEAAQQTHAATVAPLPPAAHNPGRRRMLPLN